MKSERFGAHWWSIIEHSTQLNIINFSYLNEWVWLGFLTKYYLMNDCDQVSIVWRTTISLG